MTKTKTIKGKDVQPGHHIQLEGGEFVKVTDVVRAPMRIEFEDGTTETPKWAYLSNGEHTTICKDDDVTVKV